MIKFIEHEGMYCPIMICDICSERITDCKAALVKFDNSGELLIFCHKGQCDRTSEGGERPDKWPWEQLDIFLYNLCSNVKMEWGKAKHLSDIFSNLG